MNERVKELALEAGLVRNGDWGMKRWEGPSSDSINDQDLEKFAKLIVRECAGLMDGRRIEYGNCKDGRVILKHFGVEE